MEKLAELIYRRLENMGKKPDGILNNAAVREALQALDPAGNTPKRQKEYVLRKFSLCGMVVACGVLVSVLALINDAVSSKIADNSIGRGVYGAYAESVELVADDGSGTYDIPVTIEARQYTNEELAALSKEAVAALETDILGDNAGFDKIEYDMELVRSIDGYPFDVEWYTDSTYMEFDGKLVNETLPKPHLTELTAVLSCEGFEIEHTITANIHSKALQPGNAELIARKVQELEKESRSQENVALPSELAGRTIMWSYKKSHVGVLLLAATPLLALVVYYSRDRDLYQKVAQRGEQMRMDYPEIVSSLALLIGAGMTVPNAWNKIARDYKNRVENENAPKRYAYEEMMITVYEMESGTVQSAAYEHFGRRCRIPDYNKLSTMLAQNIRKGASNLPQLLKEEAADAFEDRKHMARKLSEKAGTKLLVPMMMFLGITMVIIMVPAFQEYL